VLFETVQTSATFVKGYFREYFSYSVGADYFVDSVLDVTAFQLADDETYVKIDMDGTATFAHEPVPSQEFVTKLMGQSFKGDSRLVFLDSLFIESSSDFIQELSYLVVYVNGDAVANEDLSGMVQTNDDGGGFKITITALIAGVAAAGGAMIILLIIIMCRFNRNKERKDPQDSVRKNNTGSTDESELYPAHEMPFHGGSPENKSPSPVQSIISQASSRFTYNPREYAMSDPGDIASETETSERIDVNPFTLQVDVSQSSMDSEAWQNTSAVMNTSGTAPFGHDISAIEKKDLSLIQEGENEEVRRK
jgi:hypothetical protein